MKRAALIGLIWLLIAAPALAEVVATDFLGRRVVLEQPARRIVALSPHLVENLYSAGLGDRLVGAVSHSDYPPAARDIPRVGGYMSVSLEAIVALDPDLVVAWASGDGGGGASLSRLESLGVPVYVDRPRKPADIARAIEDLGRLGGRGQAATAAATAFRRRLASLRAQYADQTPVSLFYEIWNEPLQTLGGDQFVTHVIRLCGGRNIFADARTLAPRVSIESVLVRDPQAIIATGRSDTAPPWLDDWRNWPGLQAVRHDHLYFLPPDLMNRPTVRMLDGARMLCEKLAAVRGD
ncbi:cobalamin-binding protein [Salinisphaera sp. T31B1]|uniref:cobalamin-binding protein n=1 Tax=Salinisphaera sp. T31B1 TaxID=727963 RepID=UPI00333E3BED